MTESLFYGDYKQQDGEVRAMIKTVIYTFSLLLIVAAWSDCSAFRCGSGFVSAGDSKTKVLLECGKPTSKEKAGSKKRKKSYTKSEREKDQRQQSTYATKREKPKPLEKWYYNCGENDFIYVLTFEGGILKSEETGGYGKGNSDCRGREMRGK